jgi:hypothetical protein
MSPAVTPETMGAYVGRTVPAVPPMVEVSGSQACIYPGRRRGDGDARGSSFARRTRASSHPEACAALTTLSVRRAGGFAQTPLPRLMTCREL